MSIGTAAHCAPGEGGRSTAKGARGVCGRLGLDGLDVVGAVRGRLVLGLLVLAMPNSDRFFIGYFLLGADALTAARF